MIQRAWKYLILAALATIAGFFGGRLGESNKTTIQQPTITASMRAKKFEVVDNTGAIAAELTARELNFFDKKGRVRITLRLEYNDNGILGFSDGRWQGRAIFGFLGTDTPSSADNDWGLVIYSPESRRATASLITTENGLRGSLHVSSPTGNRAVVAP